MKTLLKPVLALALTSVFAAPAFAQATDSETTTGSTEIIQPIALTKNTDLAFGTIVRPASGSGTVTMSAAGSLSVGGGAVSIGSGQTAATYSVAGEDGRTFSISTPATFAMNRTRRRLAHRDACEQRGERHAHRRVGNLRRRRIVHRHRRNRFGQLYRYF